MALVFQYGSNCSSERLNSDTRLRGDAKSIGLVETVDNYQLRFDVWSNLNDCAASDLVRGGDTPAKGVLYEVPEYLISRETANPRERKSLDAIEGTSYERQTIQVKKQNGEVVDAITYLVREPVQTLTTSAAYVGYIVRGLREHNADEAYIAKVKRIAIDNNPAIAGASLEVLENEIAHRRDRRQQVFSWASSLLVAITGGTIALTMKQDLLGRYQKQALTLAILVLGLFAMVWIGHHWRVEKRAKETIIPYYDARGIPYVKGSTYFTDWTMIGAILLLTLAALGAVWLK
jgi:cation transport regulator ChaC